MNNNASPLVRQLTALGAERPFHFSDRVPGTEFRELEACANVRPPLPRDGRTL